MIEVDIVVVHILNAKFREPMYADSVKLNAKISATSISKWPELDN